MDIKETGKQIKSGAKQIATPNTVWIVAGAFAGLLLGVMVMHTWLGKYPSWTTRVLPNIAVPPASGPLGGY